MIFHNFKKIIAAYISFVALNLFFGFWPKQASAIEIALPGQTGDVASDPGAYIQYFFTFGLGLVGFLAVAAIVIGGIMYMTGSTVGKVDRAKTIIAGAITGVVLLLCSYLLFSIIDPTLLNISPLTPANPGTLSAPAPVNPADPYAGLCNPPCNTSTQICSPPRGCVDRPTGTAAQCTPPAPCTAALCATGGSCYMGTWDSSTCQCTYPTM